MNRVRPLPAELPSANSRKWHSRRWWDPLGYIRVRSLANPRWERDTGWLIGSFLIPGRSAAPEEDRDLFDAAIAAARRYPRTASGATDMERSWDEVLAAVDVLIERAQARHLADVRGTPES
jgi:hypothetical protein